MGGEVAWSSLPRASVRKHFSVSVYMRAVLAGLTRHLLGTAIRARPHLPAPPGLGSDICLSLVFKSQPISGTLQRAPLQLRYSLGWGPLCTEWWLAAQGHPLQS